MRPRRKLFWIVVTLTCALLILFVRVRYPSLGWGGYWSVDFAAPWR